MEVDLEDVTGWLAADDPPLGASRAVGGGASRARPDNHGLETTRLVPAKYIAEVFDGVGNGGPSLWVDGRVVGGWAQTKDGSIHSHYFERVGADRRREIDNESMS